LGPNLTREGFFQVLGKIDVNAWGGDHGREECVRKSPESSCGLLVAYLETAEVDHYIFMGKGVILFKGECPSES